MNYLKIKISELIRLYNCLIEEQFVDRVDAVYLVSLIDSIFTDLVKMKNDALDYFSVLDFTDLEVF